MTNKVQKPCRTCGKMFTPCADCENDRTMFHWKRFTCSPQCAKSYFAKIQASRQSKADASAWLIARRNKCKPQIQRLKRSSQK